MHTQDDSLIDEMVSVFIVDDHPIFIEGIQRVIEMKSDFQVCGFGTSIQEAMNAIRKIKPTIIISDISLDKESGIDLIKEVKKMYPSIKILMMSMHDEVYYIERSLKAGANGYILKSNTSGFLIEAIRTILSGKRYFNSELETKLLKQVLEEGIEQNEFYNIERLSNREQEIFNHIGRGKSTIDIANILQISERTVNSHKENIKKKLNKYSMNEVLETAIKWMKLKMD